MLNLDVTKPSDKRQVLQPSNSLHYCDRDGQLKTFDFIAMAKTNALLVIMDRAAIDLNTQFEDEIRTSSKDYINRIEQRISQTRSIAID